MAVMYKVTVKKKIGKLASGMWVEFVFDNNSKKPTQMDIIRAFNEKYGPNTLTGTISSTYIDIVKL
ncbi:MAG: hypothetical protein Q4G16_04425 [Cruoricaptor ignavus]|nr:hypothetical protein [Cruoricaptor ignavus]